MTTTSITILFLGFVLGLKHAIEADHIAAVSTIVADKKSLWGSAIVGAVWGLGHTLALLAVGILVLLLNLQISEQVERLLEFGVGVMLVFLGLNVLVKIARGGKLHVHAHEHGGSLHGHPHLHDHLHTTDSDEPGSHHGLSLSPRPLFIGLVHGLAGSAGLMLLMLPTIDSKSLGLLYIVIFGIGSIGGMMLMSFAIGVPLHYTANRFDRVNALFRCFAGLLSVGLGLWIVYEKGVAQGLFA
ncbi:MAG: urease accessory protein UreH [Pyrinomonadaceae bacterium]